MMTFMFVQILAPLMVRQGGSMSWNPKVEENAICGLI